MGARSMVIGPLLTGGAAGVAYVTGSTLLGDGAADTFRLGAQETTRMVEGENFTCAATILGGGLLLSTKLAGGGSDPGLRFNPAAQGSSGGGMSADTSGNLVYEEATSGAAAGVYDWEFARIMLALDYSGNTITIYRNGSSVAATVIHAGPLVGDITSYFMELLTTRGAGAAFAGRAENVCFWKGRACDATDAAQDWNSGDPWFDRSGMTNPPTAEWGPIASDTGGSGGTIANLAAAGGSDYLMTKVVHSAQTVFHRAAFETGQFFQNGTVAPAQIVLNGSGIFKAGTAWGLGCRFVARAQGTGNLAIFDSQITGGTNDGVTVSLITNPSVAFTTIRINIRSGGTTLFWQAPNGTLTHSTTYNMMIRYDGGTATSSVRVWLNGSELASSGSTTTLVVGTPADKPIRSVLGAADKVRQMLYFDAAPSTTTCAAWTAAGDVNFTAQGYAETPWRYLPGTSSDSPSSDRSSSDPEDSCVTDLVGPMGVFYGASAAMVT